MSGRSLVDLGLTIVGWWMIVAAPVSVILRAVFHVDVIAVSSFALSGGLAIPLAGLYWWDENSVRRLGDYILSLVVFQLVVGLTVLPVLALFNIDLTTETVPGMVFTGGILCVMYGCAYYWTYGSGPHRLWRTVTARSE